MSRKRLVKSVEADEPNLVPVVAFIVVGLLITVGVVMWGRSDRGEIDVSATIMNSNIQAREEGNEAGVVQAVPKMFQDSPNGGLVAQDLDTTVPAPTPEPAPVETASTTATTTGSVATSTEPEVPTDAPSTGTSSGETP